MLNTECPQCLKAADLSLNDCMPSDLNLSTVSLSLHYWAINEAI